MGIENSAATRPARHAVLSAAGLTTGKFAAGIQDECLDTGGLLPSFTVLKLSR